MLVPKITTDRHLGAERAVGTGALVRCGIGGRQDTGQHVAWDPEEAQQLLIPVQPLQIHQHGAAGIGHVGDMLSAVNAAGQIPQQPAVSGAELGAAAFGGLANPVDVLQDPLQLAAGKVGGWWQTGPVPDDITTTVPIKLGGNLVRTGVLPDDRVSVRLACDGIPDDRRFTLVGDPEPRQVSGTNAALCQGLLYHLLSALPDLGWIVLHPSCLGQDLLVLELVLSDLVP